MMPQIRLEPIADQLNNMVYSWHNSINDTNHNVGGMAAAMQIIATQGKNRGHLRASKPAMVRSVITRTRSIGEDNNVVTFTNNYYDYPLADCAAAQIWRYVAFEASPLSQHHSLPVMADFDAPFDMDLGESRQFAKWCQSVADVVLTTIDEKPGLNRWSRALGY